MYQPSWLGIFINPFYFARKGLSKNINKFSKKLSGSLLDIGCGSKPYESFFNVDSYIGLDIDRDVARDKKKADFFYDGGKFPFKDGSFDCVGVCAEEYVKFLIFYSFIHNNLLLLNIFLYVLT